MRAQSQQAAELALQYAAADARMRGQIVNVQPAKRMVTDIGKRLDDRRVTDVVNVRRHALNDGARCQQYLTFECAAMEDMVQHLGRQIPAWQLILPHNSAGHIFPDCLSSYAWNLYE